MNVRLRFDYSFYMSVHIKHYHIASGDIIRTFFFHFIHLFHLDQNLYLNQDGAFLFLAKMSWDFVETNCSGLKEVILWS